MLWCQGAPNIGLSNRICEIRTNMHRMITMHASLRQTDGQTDEHHGNRAAIRSMNASRANQCVRSYIITSTIGFQLHIATHLFIKYEVYL